MKLTIEEIERDKEEEIIVRCHEIDEDMMRMLQKLKKARHGIVGMQGDEIHRLSLDEIYYFEFDKPQGFGFQAVYSKEGDINEVYKVKTGDLVEVPKGYHPFTVAPGYKNYCLWIMAGKNRGIFCTSEEEHKWVNN